MTDKKYDPNVAAGFAPVPPPLTHGSAVVGIGTVRDPPLAELDDGQLIQWAQDRVLRVLNKAPDNDDRSNALLAFGILVGTALKAVR